MKKALAAILCLVMIFSLTACKKDEPKLIHKTYMGVVTEVGEDYIIIDSSTTNNTEKFLINEKTLEISFELVVGQKVLVESEFYTNEEKPYTVITISPDDR